MGFERSHRSRVRRWTTLVMLGIAGGVGAMFFIVGGSGKSLPKRGKPPETPLLGGSTVTDSTPGGPAPSLELSAAGANAARAAQITVVLDDIDATLHALRLTWPGQMGPYPWRGPAWMGAQRLERELAALDSQLAGATDPLSVRTREWIAVARPDGARVLALQAAWSAPGASADAIAGELRPIFDRLVAASRAVHAAVGAESSPPLPGTLASLAAACRVAPLLARMTVTEPPASELRALSDACLEAARVYAAANPDDQLDFNDIYQLSLATQIAINVLHEVDRRRQARPGAIFISAAGNLAQESSFLATSRRQHDPSLRPAEAPAP